MTKNPVNLQFYNNKMHLTNCFICIFASITFLYGTNAIKCLRTPEGHGALKTPADGRFHIRISENTDKYTPGKTYTSKSKLNKQTYL